MSLIELIGEKLGVNENNIKPDSNFVEDLGADSLDQVELIMACEDRYDLEISDDEANKVITVQDAFDVLERLGVAAEKLKSRQVTSSNTAIKPLNCDWCGKKGGRLMRLHEECYEDIMNGKGII